MTCVPNISKFICSLLYYLPVWKNFDFSLKVKTTCVVSLQALSDSDGFLVLLLCENIFVWLLLPMIFIIFVSDCLCS